MAQADESVLDFPQDGLCPDIWEKVISADGAAETWRMVPAVRQYLLLVAAAVCSEARVQYEKTRVWMTGSLTSNTYTSKADIDIHFRLQYKIRELGEVTQKRFKVAFDRVKASGMQTEIAGHPIEAYYQTDEFQDFMSVGCYDVKEDKWLVGPELKDPSYNPYSELYRDIQAKAGSLIQSVRSTLLDVYEKAVVTSKVFKQGRDASIQQVALEELATSLESAVQLYENARKMRKVYSSPTSVEQALQYRSSKKWKVADAAFKLMDKFGYLAILRKYKELQELLSTGDGDIALEVAEAVIAAVKEHISSPEKLAEKDQLDEGVGKALSLAALVSFMAVPDVLPAAQLEKSMARVTLQGKTANSPEVKKAVENAAGKKVDGMNIANIANAVARTIFAEAQGEGKAGQAAVASVIWNRAGGKAENLVPVVSKKLQFSCWNKYSGGWTDETYKYSIPKAVFSSRSAKQAWDNCMELAGQLISGSFKSTIGNRNSYMNKKTASKKNASSWGKDLDLDVGSHSFGYFTWNDGFRGSKSSAEHVVKRGETLSKIASDYGTTVAALAKKNGIEDPDKLAVGQRLKV